ncbi:acyltransferase family protein [Actinomyces faecalis]|uniref:acyltransferase family protein n=1 Tax=Actinomyces faecalis TaxID=2722820 RepID=UPI00155577CF|nr:acyltransferase family protein [Actinomyces faecalis]
MSSFLRQQPRPSRAGAAPSSAAGRSVRRVAGLDGLRAVAVVLVLVYHLLPGLMPGGMVGVDAFFVISGFLITSLLVTQRRASGRIDLRRFWARRLRRIVPALLIAVVVVVSLAAILGGDVLLGVRRQVLGAATLVYNWVEIAAGSSYFDLAQPLLLTNVWSLAVEEQFYLLWPFVVIAVLRGGTDRGRTRLGAWVCLGLAAVSAAAAVGLSLAGASPSRVYMGTDTHAFGLMLGAALAMWHGQATDAQAGEEREVGTGERLGRGLLGWLGLVALVTCAFLGDDGGQAGGSPVVTTLWLVAASVSAVAVIQAVTAEVSERPGPARWLTTLLEARPMTWLGQRSYGLYLWHWPIWVLAFYSMPPSSNPWVVAGIVMALTLVVAELSYRYVETPIRRKGLVGWLRGAAHAGPRSVLAMSGAVTAMALLVALAFAAQPRHSSAEEAIASGARALASSKASATQETTTAKPSPTATPSPAAEITGDQVVAVGDSVTLAAAPGLEDALPGIVIDAEVSRSFYAAVPTLQEMDTQYGARPYVVVALATNGTVGQDQLDGLLDYLGDERRLVLVTGYGPARTTWIPEANQAIRDFAAAHPEQVSVADWDAAITPSLQMLAQDQVHPGPEGGQVYAQAVLSALRSLPL